MVPLVPSGRSFTGVVYPLNLGLSKPVRDIYAFTRMILLLVTVTTNSSQQCVLLWRRKNVTGWSVLWTVSREIFYYYAWAWDIFYLLKFIHGYMTLLIADKIMFQIILKWCYQTWLSHFWLWVLTSGSDNEMRMTPSDRNPTLAPSTVAYKLQVPGPILSLVFFRFCNFDLILNFDDLTTIR